MKYGQFMPDWRVAFYNDYKSDPESATIWSSRISAWDAESAVEKFIADGDPYYDGETERFVVQNILGDHPGKHSRPIEVVQMAAYLIMDYSFENEGEIENDQ